MKDETGGGEGAREAARTSPHLGLAVAVTGIGFAGIWGVAKLADLHFNLALALGSFAFLALMLAAELNLGNSRGRMKVAQSLQHPTFTQVYTYFAKGPVGWLWVRFADPVANDAGLWSLLKGALTWRILDLAMLLAVAYPILSMVFWWIANGRDGRLGTAIVLPAAPFFPARAATIWLLALVVLSWIVKMHWASSPKVAFRRASDWMPRLAVAGAVAFAVAGAVFFLDERGRPRVARLILSIFIVTLWLVAAIWLNWGTWKEQDRTIFLFLGVLPLLNALLDALSYAITLAFIRRGLSLGLPILLCLADALVALVLFLVLGALIVTVIALLNRLSGQPLSDLGALFAGIRQAPVDYAWVYTMLFSSALPTGLHFLVGLVGFQGITPRPWRLRLSEQLEAEAQGSGTLILESLALAAIWFVPFVCAAAIGWGLWELGTQTGVLQALGWGYFDMLLSLARIEGAF